MLSTTCPLCKASLLPDGADAVDDDDCTDHCLHTCLHRLGERGLLRSGWERVNDGPARVNDGPARVNDDPARVNDNAAARLTAMV